MLVTLDDLRTRYGFSFPESQNDAYSELLSTAEEACLSYASIEQGRVEEHFKGGSSIYVLTHSPVLSVESVKIGDGDVAFRYEKRSETVVLGSEASEGVEVVVNYTCGWEEGKAPSSLRTAIAFTVQHLSKLNSAKLLGITSRSTEGGTESIEQSVPPLAVQKLLEPFRRNKVL